MNLLLKDVARWHNGQLQPADIRLANGIVAAIAQSLSVQPRDHVLDLKGYFVYPSLINAHDHLEMNLYPCMGKPPYGNYVEWARDIYKPSESPVREIEKVDIAHRLVWGGVKNLISGVGTVVHHNPWHRIFETKEFPVNVVKTAWAHSLAMEKNMAAATPKNGSPFVIHAAEGIDELAAAEISTLARSGLLSNTVLIHAIALSDRDISTIKLYKASIVWCPASNLFMFNKTADVKKLSPQIIIALGTDATMTGSPTLLHELKVAHHQHVATPQELLSFVTDQSASIFNLDPPSITENTAASFFLCPAIHSDYFENLLQIDLKDVTLVCVNGNIRYADAHFAFPSLKHTLTIQGVRKSTDVPVADLKRKIEKKVPPVILQQNPLWSLVDV